MIDLQHVHTLFPKAYIKSSVADPQDPIYTTGIK